MTFEGFTTPKKNYFPMPNNWTDIAADINNLAELKVVEYIMRHTWGYHEYDVKKAITTDEFMHGRKRGDGTRMDKGTGLSNRSVIDGLRAATEHGYIESDLDDADKARKVKYYTLKMAKSDVKHLHISDVNNLHIGMGYEETSQPMFNRFTSDVNNVHSNYEDVSHRSEKDTLERHLEKDTKEKQEVASPHVDAPRALSENKNVSHFGHNAWNCEAYCNAHSATCADYQAYIDSGQREETPTEPRTPAIQIGEHDATSTTDRQYPHAASRSMDRPATEETPVAIASTPGEATTPLVAKTRQSKNDGATTVTASEPRPSGKGKKVTQAPPELSPEVTRILDDWDSLHKKPVPRIEANITAAQLLVAAQTNREEMKGCRDWLPTTDRPGKPWYRKIGVHLPDIAAKLEQYRSLQDMSEPVPVVDKGPGSVMQAQWEAAVQALPRVNDGERRSDFDAWVGNGPEERKRWRQKSAEMKAAGYSPDL